MGKLPILLFVNSTFVQKMLFADSTFSIFFMLILFL